MYIHIDVNFLIFIFKILIKKGINEAAKKKILIAIIILLVFEFLMEKMFYFINHFPVEFMAAIIPIRNR